MFLMLRFNRQTFMTLFKIINSISHRFIQKILRDMILVTAYKFKDKSVLAKP